MWFSQLIVTALSRCLFHLDTLYQDERPDQKDFDERSDQKDFDERHNQKGPAARSAAMKDCYESRVKL